MKRYSYSIFYLIVGQLLIASTALYSQSGFINHQDTLDYNFGKKEFEQLLNISYKLSGLDTSLVFKYPAKMDVHLKNAKHWVSKYGNDRDKFLIDFISFHYDNFTKKDDENSRLDIIKSGLELLHNTQATPSEHLKIMDILLYVYMRELMLPEYLNLLEERNTYIKNHKIQDVFFEADFAKLANIYYINKNYTLARLNYKKARDAALVEGNGLILASYTNNIGLSFYDEYKFDSALYYFNQALDLFTDEDYYSKEYARYFRLIIKANIARIHMLQGKPGYQLPTIYKEIRLSKKFNEYQITTSGYLDLAMNYYLMNKFNQSFVYIDSVILFKDYSINAYKDALELKGKIYLLNGNMEAGNYFFDIKHRVEDSLNNIIKTKAVENATMSYRVNVIEKELIDKNNELSKNALLIKSQEQEGKFLRLLLVLSMLIIGLVIAFMVSLRNKNIKISEQKSKLGESLAMQENLLKEVHHRVKNNLQVVSGLLMLQASKSESEEVKQLMEQGQSRINSMAVLHQMLYNNTNYGQVNMQEYVHNLLESIGNSLGHGLKVDIEEKVLDIDVGIDKAITMGLIITELITNAYKHAFPIKKEGKIKVLLSKYFKNYKLVVSDNGIGLPPEVGKNTKTLGVTLITMLANELRANLSFKNKQGATCTLIVNLD